MSIKKPEDNGTTVVVVLDQGCLPHWPYCSQCQQPYEFDQDGPFARCSCGTTEWGNPRPADYVQEPSPPSAPTVSVYTQGVILVDDIQVPIDQAVLHLRDYYKTLDVVKANTGTRIVFDDHRPDGSA